MSGLHRFFESSTYGMCLTKLYDFIKITTNIFINLLTRYKFSSIYNNAKFVKK